MIDNEPRGGFATLLPVESALVLIPDGLRRGGRCDHFVDRAVFNRISH